MKAISFHGVLMDTNRLIENTLPVFTESNGVWFSGHLHLARCCQVHFDGNCGIHSVAFYRIRFLQTLATFGVMTAFAFVSKEETRVVDLLNQVIQNYQKFQIDTPPRKHKG